jgi:hypothetical protein
LFSLCFLRAGFEPRLQDLLLSHDSAEPNVLFKKAVR